LILANWGVTGGCQRNLAKWKSGRLQQSHSETTGRAYGWL